ncbi:MAB_1171c family putative transporter [Streptomyces sp. enrichment culture]|uniref:MAB_1171c family putative transporter n=1 Tax=Streptomyces sp. enrichment culture TaxID=1795815 RepID=UPI003F571051
MTAVRPYEAVLLLVMWPLAVQTARRALRSRSAPEAVPSRLLAGVVALVTLSVTVGVPAVRRPIDAATGVQGGTSLLGHLLGISAVACLTGFVRHMSAPADAPVRRRARDRLPLPLAAAAMTTAFVLVPRPSGEKYLLFTGHSAALVVYWAVFVGFVLRGVITVGVTCLRHHEQAPPGPLRTSLHLIGAGAAVALAYALHRGACLVLRDSGSVLFQDAVVAPTAQVLLAGSLLLSSAGIVWPAVADRRHARAVRRRLRRIEPLWRTLCAAVPEVVLPLPDALHTESELVLYRYAVEISDVILALDPYRSPAVEAAARERLAAQGFTGPGLAAATEAVVLRCAIDRARPEPAPTANPAPPVERRIPDGDPLQWLELLAVHFRHPLVLSTAATLTVPAGH